MLPGVTAVFVEFVDTGRATRYRSGMTTLTLTLDPATAEWLHREAGATNRPPSDFVVDLLRELADPDRVEGDLIDDLLARSVDLFPPVMTLDEQDEMREEVLDHLCRRIADAYRAATGDAMPAGGAADLRERLTERSREVWPVR